MNEIYIILQYDECDDSYYGGTYTPLTFELDDENDTKWLAPFFESRVKANDFLKSVNASYGDQINYEIIKIIKLSAWNDANYGQQFENLLMRIKKRNDDRMVD